MNTGGVFKSFVKRNWILSLILIVGILVRVYAFGEIPPGLFVDEASTGYDTYSIANYGIDRNGFHNPIPFMGFGSGGQSGLYEYLSIPFIRLFGLSIFSIRLVNLIFGLLSLSIFYFFVKEVSNKGTAVIATFLLAICPWHIMISRWALHSNLFPVFFLTGNLFLVYSLRNQHYLPISFIIFALSLYTYGTALFMVPLFMIILSAYLILNKKIKIKSFIFGASFFLILAIPAILFVHINTYQLGSLETPFFSIPRLTIPRFETGSVLFGGHLLESILPNLKMFLNDIIFNQNDGRIWNQLAPYGLIYTLSMPFALLGFLITMVDNGNLKKFQKNFFILLWFLLTIALAAIMSANTNRMNIIFFPLLYFTALGLLHVKDKINRPVFYAIIIVYLICFTSFSYDYFTSFPEKISSAFFESLDEAINYSAEKSSGSICVTNQISMPYIYVLFYRKIDPNIFLSTHKYGNPGSEFQWVDSFKGYYFGLDQCESINNIGAYVFHNSEENRFNTGNFSITRFKRYSVAMPGANTN